MDARGGSAGRHGGGVDRFHPAWNAIVGDHVGRPRHQLGDDRTGRLVHRCAAVRKEAACSTGALARALCLGVLEFNKSALDSDGHGMGPVIGSQLRQDVGDVVLDGFLRN